MIKYIIQVKRKLKKRLLWILTLKKLATTDFNSYTTR